MKSAISVLGSGSWATALVKILSGNGHQVHWWVRRPEKCTYIKKYKHNPDYLSAVELEIDTDLVSDDIGTVVNASDMVLFAMPSYWMKPAIQNLSHASLRNKMVISAIKGLVPDEDELISEYFHTEYGVHHENLVALGGPCHAEEIAAEKQSYLTLASKGIDQNRKVAQMLACRYVKTNEVTDIWGFELASVLKNAYAVTSGICRGAGQGDNFQAVLVSNAIREMHDYMDQVNKIDRNLLDTAYLGDLLVTCYSQHSRNRTFGTMVGKGYSVQSAQLEMNMVAEGYYAIKSLHAIMQKRGFKAPILDTTHAILYRNFPVNQGLQEIAGKLL